jgi:hypothetical protein
MSGYDEQRVIDALQAITGGITVTDNDVLDARDRLEKNLTPAPKRRRMVLAAVAAAVLLVAWVTVASLTGNKQDSAPPPVAPPPAPDLWLEGGTPPTAESMAGIWQQRSGTFTQVLVVQADGTFAYDWEGTDLGGSPGWHETLDEPPMSGSFELDGYQFSTKVYRNQLDWTPAWAQALMPDDTLHTVNTSPGADPAPSTWERVEPVRSRAFDSAAPAQGWTAPVKDTDLVGVWLPAASGQELVVINPDGGYAYYPDGNVGAGHPTDSGGWALDGRQLVLTSDGDAGSCAKGARVVVQAPRLRLVHALHGDVLWQQGDVVTNDCNLFGQNWVFQRL